MKPPRSRRMTPQQARTKKQLEKLLKKGRAAVNLTGKDRNPSFDRRLYIYLSQTPAEIAPGKIARLLNFLDRLGRGKEWPRLTRAGKRGEL